MMVLFTPFYTVSYHGKFYPAGVPIEIDEGDVPEMSLHGTVSTINEPEPPAEPEPPFEPEPPAEPEKSADLEPPAGPEKPKKGGK